MVGSLRLCSVVHNSLKKAQYLALLTVSICLLALPKGVQAQNILLMVTSQSCPWCEAFEEEVGQGYPNTPEAQQFPILRVDISDPMPEQFDHLTPALVTPTFIFIKQGEEIARIAGYPGQEMFWWRISEFVN